MGDFPIEMQFNIGWIFLLVSFMVIPLFLLIMNKWFLTIVEVVLILVIAAITVFTNLTGMNLSEDTVFLMTLYISTGLYISVGAFGMIDSVWTRTS